MKKGLTHIIFIVDRSGSMESIATDMIGGFNSFIRKQKETPSECKVSFFQFDTIYEEIYKGIDLSTVPELTKDTFQPRGSTALYDAVGRTINSAGDMFSQMKEEDRPERVLVVIITDGLNNASKEFSVEQVRNMIDHQIQQYNWEFVYIGANQDSWDVGTSLGVKGTSTISYASTGRNRKQSTDALWDTLSDKTTNYRKSVAPTAFGFSDEEREEQEKLINGN